MTDGGGIADDRLRSFVERVERLNEEIKGLQEDRKEVFRDAKSQGFDPAVMKIVIRRRAMSTDDREHEDATVETYEAALGGWDGTPLGEYAEAAQ